MDIRKADSKGRITGFTPGEHYAFDWEKGYVAKMAIHAPDGRPLEVALREDMAPIEKLGPVAEEQLRNAFENTIQFRVD